MSKNSDKSNIPCPLPRDPRREALDVFNEGRVFQDLVQLHKSPGIVSQFMERTRIRFEKANERAVINEWTTFYESGQRLMASKLALERQKIEYLLLAHDHDLKVREKMANHNKLEAEMEEYSLRRDKAAYQREHLERFIEGAINADNNEDEAKMKAASVRRQMDARWDLHESLRALNTLVELQHWRRQQRDGILRDRTLTQEEQAEDLQFIDDLFEQKRGELKGNVRIFDEE